MHKIYKKLFIKYTNLELIMLLRKLILLKLLPILAVRAPSLNKIYILILYLFTAVKMLPGKAERGLIEFYL